MRPLTLTNSQAAAHDPFIRALAHYLSQQLHHPIEFVSDQSWAEREALLDAGKIDLGWICGAPYVKKIANNIPLKILAAPVMAHPRYQNRPIYFSDVIVRADSPFQSFDDLRGARWTYNEPHSQSGYHLVRYALATRGLDATYFEKVFASGAHQTSIELVLQNRADASAIDSTVLEFLTAADPTLATRLRIIETLGPSPMPPFVSGAHVPGELRAAIQDKLTRVHETDEGRILLAGAQMSKIVRVTDADYDAIRTMLAHVRHIHL